MRITVLDDYDHSISKLNCWNRLREHFQIQFFDRPVSAIEVSSFEVIVANRERTLLDAQYLAEL
jgi:hypothetical protein